MENFPEKSHLDVLDEKVNSRKDQTLYERPVLSERDPSVQTNWTPLPKKEISTPVAHVGYSPLLYKILIASAIFFVGAAGLAFYNFFINDNLISSRKVVTIIEGPPSVRGGDPLSLEVSIANGNSVGLEGAVLIVEYPEEVTISGGASGGDGRYTKTIGPVPTGQTITERISATAFGKENTDIDIQFYLEYRTPGSSATYTSPKTVYSVNISSSPVSVTTKIPAELNSGEEFLLEVHVVANTEDPIENVLVVLNYPFGFTVTGATPAAAYQGSVWRIAKLSPNKEEIIRLKAKVTGTVDSEKTLGIRVGVENTDRPREIGTLYTNLTQTLVIKRAFIGLNFVFSGIVRETPDFIVTESGDTVSVDLHWQNNLDTKLLDGQVEVRITGATVDRQTIVAGLGEYRSSENVIRFNQRTDRTFTEINPDQKGTVHFSFKTIPLFGQAGTSFRKPEIVIDVIFTGTRISEGFNNETVTVRADKSLRLASAASISSELFFSTGPFVNRGPVPPQVEKETTYTVTWNLTNPSNDIRGAVVSAKLPAYVTWLGKSIPGSERVTYNDATGEVRWEAGDLPAGTGFTGLNKTVSFQISLVPSISQVNSRPEIVSESRFSGSDTYVLGKVEAVAAKLDTSGLKDSQVGQAGEVLP